jgi:hypothetical protein
MRKVKDIDELIKIMSSIKGGTFATVCYLSSARVKKTLRGVDTNAFGNDLDANRTDGDDEYYNTLKKYQGGEIKKFPYNGVVKMSKFQFHWQTEKKYKENQSKYAIARDALIRKYGGEPNRKEGTDTTQEYGDGNVSVGSTENTQGKMYSHQNGATIQNRSTEYFLVDNNGDLKGGISKNAIQNIISKNSDEDGVSALKKVNATDEQIASYLEELKALNFKVLKLLYDNIIFIVTTVDNEKILFFNSKLANKIGSSSYTVDINPQSFMDKARELYKSSFADLQESVRRYNKMIKENMKKKQLIRLTESDLHRVIKESVNIILNEIGDTHRGQYMLGRLSNRQHHDYGKFAPRNGEYNSALTTAINAKRPHYKDFNQGYEHEEKLGKKIDNPKGDDEFFDFIYQGKKDRDLKEN